MPFALIFFHVIDLIIVAASFITKEEKKNEQGEKIKGVFYHSQTGFFGIYWGIMINHTNGFLLLSLSSRKKIVFVPVDASGHRQTTKGSFAEIRLGAIDGAAPSSGRGLS